MFPGRRSGSRKLQSLKLRVGDILSCFLSVRVCISSYLHTSLEKRCYRFEYELPWTVVMLWWTPSSSSSLGELLWRVEIWLEEWACDLGKETETSEQGPLVQQASKDLFRKLIVKTDMVSSHTSEEERNKLPFEESRYIITTCRKKEKRVPSSYYIKVMLSTAGGTLNSLHLTTHCFIELAGQSFIAN